MPPSEKHWFVIREGNIRILPVIHERVEFADAVRLALESERPAAVAVELPSSLQEYAERAVLRLPKMSVMLYESRKGSPIYWIVSPADPLVEGVRWGLENNVPVHFVDVDIDAPVMQWHEAVPDIHAATVLGHETFYRKVVEGGAFRDVHPQDRLREKGMAFRLKQLAENTKGTVLFICGMAHAERIREDLQTPLTEPMDRRERTAVHVFHLHPDSMQEVLWDPPYVQALYEMRRKGLPEEPERPEPDLFGTSSGPFRIFGGGKPTVPRDENKERREALQWCARRCRGISKGRSGDPISFEEIFEYGGPEPRPEDHMFPIDRQTASWRWIQRTALLYRQRTGEKVAAWQLHHLMRFSRNYALLEGRLLPDYYQWIASGRACVDENFAYELWALGGAYPWQEALAPDTTTLRVRGEDLWLGTKRMRIRPKVPRKRRPNRFPIRSRKRETRPGEWLESFDGTSLCSYPPEDVIVERFGEYLKDKGVQLLSDEKSRVEPFVSSLLDGIDLRETLRNWHEKRIYVRETRRVRGGVGAVVVIFDPDEHGDRYPYRMTWLGEHDQESDMAFYATPLGENMVGPGISRCEYGGFVMTYPPRRMWDVWKDSEYAAPASKPEVLLVAALEYSVEPNVVYIAAKPPRSWFHSLAGRMDRKIVYIPIGQLSPTTLKKIRVFHVLSGYDKRNIAKDYIH